MFFLAMSVGSVNAQEDQPLDNLRPIAISFDRHDGPVDIIVTTEVSIGNETVHTFPLVTQIKINGETVDTISESVTTGPKPATDVCYITWEPCPGKLCPNLGPLPGVCEARWVPWPWSEWRCFCVYIKLTRSDDHTIDPGSLLTVTLDPYNDVPEFNEDDNELTLYYPPPVGGIAELADVSDSGGRNYIAVAGLAAAALVALTAGGWYARRRLLR